MRAGDIAQQRSEPGVGRHADRVPPVSTVELRADPPQFELVVGIEAAGGKTHVDAHQHRIVGEAADGGRE